MYLGLNETMLCIGFIHIAYHHTMRDVGIVFVEI